MHRTDHGADAAKATSVISLRPRQSDAQRGIGNNQTLNFEGGVVDDDTSIIQGRIDGESLVINQPDTAGSGMADKFSKVAFRQVRMNWGRALCGS
jgi:hypothetical protein